MEYHCFTGALCDKLDREVKCALDNFMSSNTSATRKSQWNNLNKFCNQTDTELPLSVTDLCRYIAYLSHSLQYSSIVQYVSAAKCLHNLLQMDTSQFDNYLVKATLKGFRRSMGDQVNRKLPLTIDMLNKIVPMLQNNSGLKAIVLTGFFTFARKSNLVPPSQGQFNAEKHLCRGSFVFNEWGVIIKICWSKTIQFNERTLYLPIVSLDNSHLCPVTAIKQHFAKFPAEDDQPAFYYSNSKGISVPFTHSSVQDQFKNVLLNVGVDPKLVSCHSWRRGGADFAHSVAGIDLPLIQAQGDWASLSVLCYLTRPLTLRVKAAHIMAEHVNKISGHNDST